MPVTYYEIPKESYEAIAIGFHLYQQSINIDS